MENSNEMSLKFKLFQIKLAFYNLSWIVFLKLFNEENGILNYLYLKITLELFFFTYNSINLCNRNKSEYKDIQDSIIQNSLLIIMDFIFLSHVTSDTNIFYASFPLFSYILYITIFNKITSTFKLFYWNEYFMKIMVMFQIFMFMLKYSNVLNLNWPQTFAVAFIYIAYLGIASFQYLMLLIVIFVNICKGKENNDAIPILFYFTNHFIFYLNIMLGILEIISKLSNKQYEINYLITVLIIIGMIFQFIFNIFTTERMEKHFRQLYPQIIQDDYNHTQLQTNATIIEKKQRVIPDKGHIDVKQIPKYLKKFNSTFYKIVEYKETPKLVQETKKIVTQQKKIESKPQETQKLQDELQLDVSQDLEQQEIKVIEYHSKNASQLNSQRSQKYSQLMSNRSNTSVVSNINECIVCYENPPDCVFLNCGHAGTCYECSLDLWEKNGECYLCRNMIDKLLQIDLKIKLENNFFKVISATSMINDK